MEEAMVRLISLVPFPRKAVRLNPTEGPSEGIAARLVSALILWAERARQRRHLARLDDALLKDIGLTRCDAEMESAKPFWKE
jgi:uncharacterized protein YjiS (DUF1127 family)